MAKKVDVQLSRAGVHSVLTSSEVIEALGDIAAGVAARAQQTAPVESGDYKASIGSDVVTAEALGITRFKFGGADRAAGVVYANSPYSLKVEAATGNLKRALGG